MVQPFEGFLRKHKVKLSLPDSECRPQGMRRHLGWRQACSEEPGDVGGGSFDCQTRVDNTWHRAPPRPATGLL